MYSYLTYLTANLEKARFPSVFCHVPHGRHSPSNANALYLLGMCALELGKPQEAVSLMTKSLPRSRTWGWGVENKLDG